jgi:methionine salvage enolase-phosphatase E1
MGNYALDGIFRQGYEFGKLIKPVFSFALQILKVWALLAMPLGIGSPTLAARDLLFIS